MKGLKSIAAIAGGAAKEQIAGAVQAGVRQALFGLVIALCLLLALGFGFATLTVWLAGELGTIPALGIMAGGFLVLALIVYAISRASRPKPRRRQPPPPSPAEAAAAFVKEELDSENPPPGSALGALTLVALVGFTLARRMLKR